MQLEFEVTGYDYEEIKQKAIEVAKQLFKTFDGAWYLALTDVRIESTKHINAAPDQHTFTATAVAATADSYLIQDLPESCIHLAPAKRKTYE